MEYPERPECDFTDHPRHNYARCTWCHGVKTKHSMVYKNRKPFCCHQHLVAWEEKNLSNHWLGGK